MVQVRQQAGLLSKEVLLSQLRGLPRQVAKNLDAWVHLLVLFRGTGFRWE
jgi:hypothetical protein